VVDPDQSECNREVTESLIANFIVPQGTDVTETFETHHLTPKAGEVIKKYFVRDAAKPRNYKFTFDENGFYKTLKRRVAEKLKTVGKAKESRVSKLILDSNLIALFAFSFLAVRADSVMMRVLWTLLASQCMAWSANFAHNFMHQKDNWRMYTANISFLNFRDFRVFHVMSHHMFPNTITDLEVSIFEKPLQWLPYESKTKVSILISFLLTPIIWSLAFHKAAYLR
jgi:hypothetical protein